MKRTVILLGLLVGLSFPAWADDRPTFTLAIVNHRFEPAELTVPAATRVVLLVENRDATPEEFESHELNREKVIPAHGSVKIFLGPLEPGTYPFFGEFNQATAQGRLIVK